MNIEYNWETVFDNQTAFIFDADKIGFTDDYITLIDPADTSMPVVINVEGIDFTFLTRLVTTYAEYASGSTIRFQIILHSDSEI